MYFFNINLKVITCLLLGISFTQFYYKNYLLFILIFIFIFSITLVLANKHNKSKVLSLFIISSIIIFSYFNNKQTYFDLPINKTLVRGVISGVPKVKANSVIFDFKIANNKNKIQLTWFNPKSIKLVSGDYWQFLVKLQPPRNFATPGSFNLEQFFLINNITAKGTVIVSPDNKLQKAYKFNIINFRYLIDRIRQKISNRILALNLNYKDLIISLILGIKHTLNAKDLLIFNNTGTSHLLAISGLHLGLIAGFWFYLINYLSKKLMPIKVLYFMPTNILAAISSLLCIWLYSFMAGFSIATYRALLMANIYLFNIIFKQKFNIIVIYCLALVIILLESPYQILSCGFWLSFGALAVLLYKKPKNILITNLAMFVGLMPMINLNFGQISFIAIIANLVAIPVISFIILPISLFGIFCPYLLILADFSLKYLMFILAKLANLPFSCITIARPSIIEFLIMLFGSIWLLAPRGLLSRFLGLSCFLPLLFKANLLPNYGEFKVSVLDVGQGLAVIIKLKNNILLYDAGPNNKVALNYLKYFNYNKIKQAIISHKDLDHIGGLDDIRQFAVINNMIDDCRYNNIITRHLDGVLFELLPVKIFNKNNKNNNSCVLKISTNNNSVLLTGDVGKIAEYSLIKHYWPRLTANILLIPHHGSNSSSTMQFIQAVNPKYAVVSAGYLNRYGHPKDKVINRYLAKNITIFNTIEHGTIDFIIKPTTIDYSYYRDHKK